MVAQATVPALSSFPEYHAGRLDEADGGMEGQKFAGRAGGEDEGVVHRITIAFPIQGIPRQLLELIGAVGRSWVGFLQLLIRAAVIAADAEAALGDVGGLGGVGGGLLDDVGSRGRGRLRGLVEAAR